jgi:hypothetical protein
MGRHPLPYAFGFGISEYGANVDGVALTNANGTQVIAGMGFVINDDDDRFCRFGGDVFERYPQMLFRLHFEVDIADSFDTHRFYVDRAIEVYILQPVFARQKSDVDARDETAILPIVLRVEVITRDVVIAASAVLPASR